MFERMQWENPNPPTCTLINRTDPPMLLKVTFEGRDIPIEPGENVKFPLYLVPYAKSQNPIKGTQDPYEEGAFKSYVGVKGTKDDLTPVKPSKAIELINRQMLDDLTAQKAVKVRGTVVRKSEARAKVDLGDTGAGDQASA